MKPILVQSPTRVDLAGGTLDLWPLYLFIHGAVTVNVAIDVYTLAEITPHDGARIILESKDLNLHKEYSNLQEALSDQDPRMILLRTQLRYWQPQRGFSLRTSSQSPIGGGLGGSSSLTISLMKAFSQFTQKKFHDIHQMVHIAHNIEAEILNTPTGTQDYYPAASGGMNILKYNQNGVTQEVLPQLDPEFSEKFMLVYTGKAHHSGLNNFEVMKDAVLRDPRTVKALLDLKEIARETEKVCREKRWSALGALFRQEFEARVRLAPEFSSPEIEKLNDVSLHSGAEAVKICGAGGGGCVLVWCPSSRQQGVAEACQKAGFQVMDAKPLAPLSV